MLLQNVAKGNWSGDKFQCQTFRIGTQNLLDNFNKAQILTSFQGFLKINFYVLSAQLKVVGKQIIKLATT